MSITEVGGTYRVEMKRKFNASCERVFKAWTDPKALMSWLAPGTLTKCTSAEVDLKVGGKYRIVLEHPDGDKFISSGEYIQIDPPHKLAFTWNWDESSVQPGPSEIFIEIIPHGDQAEMTLVHAKLASDESAKQHTQGWTGCINGLEAYLTGG